MGPHTTFPKGAANHKKSSKENKIEQKSMRTTGNWQQKKPASCKLCHRRVKSGRVRD